VSPPKLFFRCVNFRVEASLVQLEAVSDIESHVLRAVEAGFDTLGEVRALLGLGAVRTAMETINGMMRRNLLVIDFRSGRFHIPSAVKTALAGEATQLPAGGQQYGQTRMFTLCLNRCTGELTSARSLRGLSLNADQARRELVFQPDHLHGISELDRVAVMNRIDALVRAQALMVRDLDLQSATPVREGGLLADIYPIEWGPAEDDAVVTLHFDPDQRVSPRETAALEALVLESRGHRRWLWERLEPRVVGAADAVARTHLRCLPDSPASLARDLRAKAGSVLDAAAVSSQLRQLSAMLDRSERVLLRIGASEVTAGVSNLIAGRERQAVLVCPFLSKRHATPLVSQLDRSGRPGGAPIGVIWGIEKEGSASDAEVADALNEVPNVVISALGSETHAKLVVQDAKRALIATKNFLSSGDAAKLFDVGVEVEAGPATAEALEWATRIGPPAVTSALRWTPSELPTERSAVTGFPLPPSEQMPASLTGMADAIADLVPDDAAAGGVAARTLALKAWWEEASRDRRRPTPLTASTGELAALADELSTRLDAHGYAPCQLVQTPEHRALMFDALERATDWVMISSHKLGVRPLGPNWRRALTDALDRGVNVGMVWGEGDDDDGRSRLLEQLQELAKGREGALVVNEAPVDIHCKLLVVDGWSCVVSSFEFLHFLNNPGYTRHELGVWIGSERVTSRLVLELIRFVSQVDEAFGRRLEQLAGDPS
jgi:hypothetical protein